MHLTSWFKFIVCFAALALTTCLGTAHAAIPQPGLWIVDAETTGKPGRGFQIDLQNRTLVFTYYGYKFGGAPTFFLASGPLTDGGLFESQLMEYQGGRTFGGPQQDAVATNSAGSVSVRFVSPTAGLITFPGEPEKSISRFSFADTSVRLKSGNFDGVTYGINSSPVTSDSTKFTFSLSSGSLTLTRAATIAGTCTFNGTYTLAGTALQSSGTYSCSDATNGTYRADGLQVDENGLYSAAFYRKKAGTTAEIKEVHAGSGALAATTSAGASIPQPGLWIVDAEATGKPGRGFQIDLQNRTLVFTYYGYKFGGAPTFFLASGPLTDAGSFEAQLMEYQGGTTLGGPQQDAVAKNSAGLVSVRFVSPTAGLITFPGEPEKSISRFSFADTSVRLKSGNFDGVTYGISSSPDSTKFTFSLSNGSLTLTRAATIAGTCTFNGTYTLAGTALQSSGTYSCSDATNGTYRADGLQVDENGLYSAAFYRKKTGTTAEIKEVHAGSSALAPAALITTLPRMRGFQIGANAGWSNKADSRWQNLSSATESGANVVRLFLEQYEPTTGAAFPGATLTDRVNASLNSYGDLVETLLAKNMIVILALDTYFTYPASHTWPDDGATLWSNPKAQQEVVDMWASLATRYKGRSGLIFDLMNEPHGVSAAELKDDHLVARTQWDALSKRTISVVSQTDSQRSMLVEPIWGEAPYLKYLTPSDNARVIYSFHYYNPHNFTHQGIPGWPAAGTVNYPSTTRDKDTAPLKIWDKTTVQNDLQVAKDFAVKNNVRVVLGEAGVMRSAPAADRLSWATDVLGVAESMGFDVVWFQYDGWGVPSTFRTGWSWENSELDSLLRDFFKKN